MSKLLAVDVVLKNKALLYTLAVIADPNLLEMTIRQTRLKVRLG